MKFLLALILSALAGGAGWMAYPGIHQKLEAKRQAAVEAAEAREELKRLKGQSGGGELQTKSQAAELLSSFKNGGSPPPSRPPEASSERVPLSAEGGMDPSAQPPGTTAVDSVEERYPLPEFRTIEEITKEWTVVPARAFPRTVKTKVSVTFEGPSGKTVLPENSPALAVGMVQGMLILMRDKNDSARSMTPLANTDLKESLSAVYEKFKTSRRDQVLKQRERARAVLAKNGAPTEQQIASAGPKPATAAGGVIPAMQQSLAAKEITETSLDKVTSWGELKVENVEGRFYWTGTLQCTVDNALFGAIPTELTALIRDDRVVKWLYSGSREPVQ